MVFDRKHSVLGEELIWKEGTPLEDWEGRDLGLEKRTGNWQAEDQRG